MYEKINYKGWPNCIRLYNEEIELIVTTDIGPRILRFGFIDRQNFLYIVPKHCGKTGGDEWLIYGGHRLWLAPEAIPFSYSPDNDTVDYVVSDYSITLNQQKESVTGIVKQMEITLSPGSNEVKVHHRVTNKNAYSVILSIWPITMLATGGRAIIPQEPYGEGDDFLLPARAVALWSYTKMNDPRWTWGEKYIQAQQSPAYITEQKIGVTNKREWVAYYLDGELLIKKFKFNEDATYPDYNCNNEVYIAKDYLEIETLSPLTTLIPGGKIEHAEYWLLAKASADDSDQSIDENILPLVKSFKINDR